MFPLTRISFRRSRFSIPVHVPLFSATLCTSKHASVLHYNLLILFPKFSWHPEPSATPPASPRHLQTSSISPHWKQTTFACTKQHISVPILLLFQPPSVQDPITSFSPTKTFTTKTNASFPSAQRSLSASCTALILFCSSVALLF